MENPVMMTIRTAGSAPTLDEIKARYGLQADEIDESFGVVEIEDGAFTILVNARAASKIAPGQDWKTEGPFSNPTIEPMWPPKE